MGVEPKTTDGKQRLVLVTGPSGAGRATAIHALEDSGYEAIDNMPLSLLPRLLQGPAYPRPLALGLDVRNREFSTRALLETIEDLTRRTDLQFEVVYLDCSDDVLLRRFSETRRRHPLAGAEDPLRGIAREKQALDPVRDRADILIDSSDLSPHDMRAEITRLFSIEEGLRLAVSLHSFSYKRGLPRSADMVFDCRFLQNPHWQPELRALTGCDPRVAQYVSEDPRYAAFLEQVGALCTSLLPAYTEEGKSHFTIAFGCSGGRHRSVAVTEVIAQTLALAGWQVSCRHRELERELGQNQ
ncbi:MAG: RNase adapter RapZ [Planktotalea sp.]|uniref:RNase adapter RapZ n=1 Tax=Planktotalea sp. TaxID=2029877 RepID=UPI003C773C01